MEGKAREAWKQHTWLDFLFEIILTSESGAQVDQGKAGRSEKFLAQEECVKVQERCQQRAWQEPKNTKGSFCSPRSKRDASKQVG